LSQFNINKNKAYGEHHFKKNKAHRCIRKVVPIGTLRGPQSKKENGLTKRNKQ